MQCKNHKEEKKLLHSICEVNIDGKMALVSLYDDLPHFEYDLTIDNVSILVLTSGVYTFFSLGECGIIIHLKFLLFSPL